MKTMMQKHSLEGNTRMMMRKHSLEGKRTKVNEVAKTVLGTTSWNR